MTMTKMLVAMPATLMTVMFSEWGGGTPDDSVLDLHLKLLKLRANPLGLARFSPEEEVLIELLQLLRELHCPLKAFEIILK